MAPPDHVMATAPSARSTSPGAPAPSSRRLANEAPVAARPVSNRLMADGRLGRRAARGGARLAPGGPRPVDREPAATRTPSAQAGPTISEADLELFIQQLTVAGTAIERGDIDLTPELVAELQQALDLAPAAMAESAPAEDQKLGAAVGYASVGAFFGFGVRLLIYMEGRGMAVVVPSALRSAAQIPINFGLDVSMSYSSSGEPDGIGEFAQNQALNAAASTGSTLAHNAIVHLAGKSHLAIPMSLLATQIPISTIRAVYSWVLSTANQHQLFGDPDEHPYLQAGLDAATVGGAVSTAATTTEAIKAGLTLEADQAGRAAAGVKPRTTVGQRVRAAGRQAAAGARKVGAAAMAAARSPRTTLVRAGNAIGNALRAIGPGLRRGGELARKGLSTSAGRARVLKVSVMTFALPAIQQMLVNLYQGGLWPFGDGEQASGGSGDGQLSDAQIDELREVLLATWEGRSPAEAAALGRADETELEPENYDSRTLIKETIALLDRVQQLPPEAVEILVLSFEASNRLGLVPGVDEPTIEATDDELRQQISDAWSELGATSLELCLILLRMGEAGAVNLADGLAPVVQGSPQE